MVNPDTALKSSPRRSTAFASVPHGGGFAKLRATGAFWSASLAFPPFRSGGFARPDFGAFWGLPWCPKMAIGLEGSWWAEGPG
jgi:hypothetical protein